VAWRIKKKANDISEDDPRRTGINKASRLRWARVALARKRKNSYPSWMVPAGLVFGSIGILAFTLIIIKKVQSGHGLDSYRSAKGVEFTYLRALIVIVVIAVTLIAGLIIKYRNTLK
jgi:hypothetical protein